MSLWFERNAASLPGVIFAALLALHWPWLRLPYYWDEAGYFIPAALDVFRHGWLVPHSTLVNGHPPLVSIWLALAWTAGGFHPATTRAAMLVFAVLLLWGLYRLGTVAVPELHARAGLAAALLCGAAPLVFAQADLAQLDLPAAAFIVWALVFRRQRRTAACAVAVTLACLSKETALIVPLAWWTLDTSWHRLGVARAGGRRGVAERFRAIHALLPLSMAAAALVAWFLYVHHAAGVWLGDPNYLSYNLQGTDWAPRFALALLRRCWQLAGYNGLWLVSGLALWAAVSRGGGGARSAAGDKTRAGSRLHRDGTVAPWPSLRADCMAVIAVYLVFHALVGGAVLARYLLPALALYLLLLADAILRLPRAGWLVAACVAFLFVNWFWNPPYPFPYEDNLAYTHFVRLQQQSAARLETMAPGCGDVPIWTAWPATDELRDPDLGYVHRPLPVVGLPDFSPASLALARAAVDRPAALFLYSRQYEPVHDLARRTPLWLRWSRRYFGYAPAASPAAWLSALGLRARAGFSQAGQWTLIASASTKASARGQPPRPCCGMGPQVEEERETPRGGRLQGSKGKPLAGRR